MWNSRRKKVHTSIKIPHELKKCTIFSVQWLERKDSASQLFLFEYLDVMQCVLNSRITYRCQDPSRNKKCKIFSAEQLERKILYTAFLKDMTKSRLTIRIHMCVILEAATKLDLSSQSILLQSSPSFDHGERLFSFRTFK